MTRRLLPPAALLLAAASLSAPSAPARAQMTPLEMGAQAQAQAEAAARLAAEAQAASAAEAAAQARVEALEAALRSSQEAAEDSRDRLIDLTQRQYAAEEQLHRRRAEHAAAFGAMISLAKAPAPALAAYSDRPDQAARASSALLGVAEALQRDARLMREALIEIETLRRETQAARAEALQSIEAVRHEDLALKQALSEGRGKGAAAAEEAERLRLESEALGLRAAQLQAAMAAAPEPPVNPRRLPPALPYAEFGFAPPPAAPAAPPLYDAPPVLAAAPEPEPPPVRMAYAAPPRETIRDIYAASPQKLEDQRAREPVMGARLMARFGETLSNGLPSFGMHYEAPASSFVYAPFSGVVEFAGAMKNVDQLVILRVDPRHTVVLAGLGAIEPKILGKTGAQLAAGESLGRLSAAHEGRTLAGLYLELRRDGEPVDPSPWLGALNER